MGHILVNHHNRRINILRINTLLHEYSIMYFRMDIHCMRSPGTFQDGGHFVEMSIGNEPETNDHLGGREERGETRANRNRGGWRERKREGEGKEKGLDKGRGGRQEVW